MVEVVWGVGGGGVLGEERFGFGVEGEVGDDDGVVFGEEEVDEVEVDVWEDWVSWVRVGRRWVGEWWGERDVFY